jgi:thiamine pyrophosphate-dependent acetolactate synthase large subunit-like protein
VLARPGAVGAQAAPPAPPKSPSVGRPSAALTAAETQPPSLSEPAAADASHVGNPGSDFMVDLLKRVGIDYVALMPGSTFRGLQESIAAYAGDKNPGMIVCTHEEASAAISHGYAKVAGKPMACLVHSTVGLQHASMGIFNAWCDRVPIMVLAGNIADESKRRPGVEWYHTAQDLGALVRDYTKWDDNPASLQHYAESFMRAYTMSVTPPMEPVLIIADSELQENPITHADEIVVPPLREPALPVAGSAALAQAAAMLANAKSPVIVADRGVRTQEGMNTLVALAEALNAPVVDLLGRMNFPSNHYLNQSTAQGKLVGGADVILALEVGDLWGVTNTVTDAVERKSKRLSKPDVQVISLSTAYLYGKSNMQDAERYYAPTLPIGADAESSLPALLDAVRSGMSQAQRDAAAARAPQWKQAYDKMRNEARESATRGWEGSPIATARLSQEIWNVIKDEDWALVSGTSFVSRWPQRLWDITKTYQYIGDSGGYGVGYGAPAAVGAAIAHRDIDPKRIPVNIQTDGDLMVLPGVLWTAAHHSVPLLTVMHNNRAWHQETMHLQRMASRRQRHPESGTAGTVLHDPAIDYAAMAKSMGMWAEGPISNPDDLGPALQRALAVVKSGKPAFLDVLTQPR